MQRAEFVNDLRCNYLTVPYEGREDDFALRMLTENVTEGFLPVELRRMDGQAYLYYNISGMQNMETIYAEKTIDREGFQTFMWHLHEAIEQSRELFLPGEGICLEPSVLFWNLGIRRWEFVYLPGLNDGEMTRMQSGREQLAEFLVMRIDYADKKLTDIAYRFYEEICAGRMHPDIFLEREDIKTGEGWEDEQAQEIGKAADILSQGQEMEEWEEKEREGKPEAEKASGGGGPRGILVILWCAAVAGTLFLGRTMQDVFLPGGAVIGLLTVLLLISLLKGKRSRKDSEPGQEDMIYMEEENIYIPYETEDKETGETMEGEKTVYMDIIRSEQERKLYGTGKFRRQKICLDGLPCVIGKDQTLADHIITDESVSRMHARFFADQEMIWMQDLNSTNGTYHNGLRLRPNGKAMLEPEDEVGFGRVQFVFR